MSEKKWTFDEVDEMYRRFNPSAINGGGKKILVAEDSPPMRALIVSSFEKKGFTVFQADNGLTALRLIKKELPDCCLLDINMPQVSGLDILEAIKKDAKYSSIPVFMVTARKEKRDILLATKMGAAGYIVKPFEMANLIQRISDTLGTGEGPQSDS
ncbi:MAG: response regulator [Planctomycetes bacterium]|nr:response regulator [Planctomycetota bacterium]